MCWRRFTLCPKFQGQICAGSFKLWEKPQAIGFRFVARVCPGCVGGPPQFSMLNEYNERCVRRFTPGYVALASLIRCLRRIDAAETMSVDVQEEVAQHAVLDVNERTGRT